MPTVTVAVTATVTLGCCQSCWRTAPRCIILMLGPACRLSPAHGDGDVVIVTVTVMVIIMVTAKETATVTVALEVTKTVTVTVTASS